MLRKNLKIQFGTLVFLMIVAGACREPQVRVVSLQASDARRVGIGFIENRDIRYSPFSSKNFSDMLGFELMQNGYRLSDVDFSELHRSAEATGTNGASESPVAKIDAEKNETATNQSGETQPVAPLEESDSASNDRESVVEPSEDEETYADSILPDRSVDAEKKSPDDRAIDPAQITDGTNELLPRSLRNIAGELEPRQRVISPEHRRLTGQEIARLSKSNRLDYYIQGAIGRTETGLLLETQENTLIFLEVFSPAGERVGAINLSVNDETLQRSSFLQEISAQIIAAFDRELGR